jgi:phage major head subunit gpT-like protein
VRFAAEGINPEADRVFKLIQDGIVQNVSVGYRIHKMEKTEESIDKVPVFRAVDWEPHEISAVAMGADDGAGFRSSPEVNTCEFTEKTMSEEIKAAPAVDEKQIREEARKLEQERVSGILHSVRAAKLGDEFSTKLIEAGTSLDEARAQVLSKLAEEDDKVKTESHVRIEVGEGEKDKAMRGMQAALLVRMGPSSVAQFKKFDPSINLDGGEFTRLSLVEIARECLEASGVSTRRMSMERMIGTALTQRSGYATTSDFAVLFENVMYKALQSAYATTEDTWSKICKQTTVRDFRASNRFRNGTFGTLDSINEHGEFTNKSIPDGAKTYIELGTKGNMIAISRQAIINDDMGAFADLAQRFGRMAALTIENDFYTQLALNSGLGPTQSDSQAFFHSNRANVNATGAALSVAALDADRVKMRQQKDQSNNEYLDIEPRILLVPVGLELAAKTIMTSQFDHASGNLQKPNPLAGSMEVVSSPRLTASTTRRYLFAPKEFGTVEAVFLEGVGNSPVLESQDGWRVDGTEWKLRLDYAIKFMDGKGAVTNAGT